MRGDVYLIKLAMARSCMDISELVAATEMPTPTVKSAIGGKSVRPVTIGRIAKALKVDVAEILANEKEDLA